LRLEGCGEPLELGVARGAERHVRGHERLAGASPDLGEERGAETVPLEQPVQARAEHPRPGVERAIVLSPVAVVEVDAARCAAAAPHAAVANLLARDPVSLWFPPP